MYQPHFSSFTSAKLSLVVPWKTSKKTFWHNPYIWYYFSYPMHWVSPGRFKGVGCCSLVGILGLQNRWTMFPKSCSNLRTERCSKTISQEIKVIPRCRNTIRYLSREFAFISSLLFTTIYHVFMLWFSKIRGWPTTQFPYSSIHPWYSVCSDCSEK